MGIKVIKMSGNIVLSPYRIILRIIFFYLTSPKPKHKSMNWWKDYFDEAWIIMQQHTKSPEQTEQEIAFLNYFLHTHTYQKILDVPCSTGRIALQLASKGFEITAMDYNEKLLEIGKQEAIGKVAEEIKWVQGDMRQLNFEGDFDAVLCLFNSFGYFEDADNLAFLEGAYRALKPGGCLLIDAHVMETLLPIFTSKGFWKFEDCIVLEERILNYETGRMDGSWTVIQDDKQTISTSSVRVYTYRQLVELLKQVGFTEFISYGSYFGDGFVYGDDQLLLAAFK